MQETSSQKTGHILVVDDEISVQTLLKNFLSKQGFWVETADDGTSALELMEEKSFNLILSDLKMPRMGGIEFLEHVQKISPQTITIIMTGFGTVETAIKAMKIGAYDYILKPFKLAELLLLIERGLDKQMLEQENRQLKETLSLYKLSESMSGTLSLERILEIIMNTTIMEVYADAISLAMFSKTGDNITGKMFRSMPPFEKEKQLLDDIYLDKIMDIHRKKAPLMVHGDDVNQFFNHNLSKEVVSFVSVPLKTRDKILGVLNAHSFTPGNNFNEGQRRIFSILASRASAAIENAHLHQDLKTTFQQTIQGFARAIEAKDFYTRGHSDRVAKYTHLITKGLKMNAKEMEQTGNAALLHDIGKIGIRWEGLNKPGKLTPTEYEMFKAHPTLGKRILEPITFLAHLVPVVYAHHERFDGQGYPQGLKGYKIPLGARILAVSDTYDAMTSDRAYRRALPHQKAVEELRMYSGSQFDPEIVEIFCQEIESFLNKT